MAILKHDDEHRGGLSSQRFVLMMALPGLLSAGLIGWVWCSPTPMILGSCWLLGPHCPRPTTYFTGDSPSSPTTTWSATLLDMSKPIPVTPAWARTQLPFYTWSNDGAVPHIPARTFRHVWEWGDVALFQEIRKTFAVPVRISRGRHSPDPDMSTSTAADARMPSSNKTVSP